MISNQELLKILIFFSILWATLSSGSSQWRRKGMEDDRTFSEPRKENGAMNGGWPVSWRNYSHRMTNFEQHRQLNNEHPSSKIFTKSVSVQGGKSRKIEIRNLISEFENENKTLGEPSDTSYPYWKGGEENANFSEPHQPVWPLPEQNTSFIQNKKLKILPLSAMHELWYATNRILMTDYGNFTNSSSHHLSPVRYHNQSDLQEGFMGISAKQVSQKGDTEGDILNTEESRGMMNGGGQPILLIKDKGDEGGGDMTGHPGMNGKDAIGPMIMMLTPLIMMCIMMPMMMSIMGGMMNFMKGIATMMIMVNNQVPGIGGQFPGLNKVRKTDDDSAARGRILLGSIIMEVAEKLETALSKYEI